MDLKNKKLQNHFDKILNYLHQEQLLKNYILTSFGLITKEINEINPLIFGYMAFENCFDKITFSELCAFLSVFFEFKENNVYPSDLDLNENEKDLLGRAEEITVHYQDSEIKLMNELPYPIFQNYNITLENYEVVKLWAEGKSWQNIKLKYNNFEGNFCKLILRIHNILREIKTIFEILNKNFIVEMINENEDILLREIVQTQSLYLI